MWSNNQCRMLFVVEIFYTIFTIDSVNAISNLSCYQCERTKMEECDPSELLPCDEKWDRCVTHIMKDDTDGFKIQRQCGLGPCTFSDLMMDKQLGMGIDSCDRSRHEYFCLFCCRESGCNKSDAVSVVDRLSNFVLFITSLLILV